MRKLKILCFIMACAMFFSLIPLNVQQVFASNADGTKEEIIQEHSHTWDEKREVFEDIVFHRVECSYRPYDYETEKFYGDPCTEIFEGETLHKAISVWIDHNASVHKGEGGYRTMSTRIEKIPTGEYETIHHEAENCIVESKENETAPTCTEPGGYDDILYCTYCEKEVYRNHVTIPATGHTYRKEWVDEVKDPDCVNEGKTVGYVCEVCNDVIFPKTIPALGHDFGEWTVTKEPTCTEVGVRSSFCTRCGVETSEFIPHLEHDYKVKETKAATCTESGYTLYECSLCGDTYSITIPATGHTYKQETVKPTCTEQGYTIYTCKTCGDSYRGDYTDATDHNWGDWTVTRDATETEEGIETRTCLTDPSHTETRVIPAKTHTHTLKKVPAVAATCAKEGTVEHYICTGCNRIFADEYGSLELTAEETVAPKTAHTWDTGKVTKAATCVENGIKTYTCTVCGQTKTETIARTGHTIVKETVKPTCTEEGYTLNKCSVCGYSYKTNVRPETGHDWGEWAVTKAATETEEGIETRVCLNDKTHTETRTIPATSHQHKITLVPAKAATCKEEGNSEYYICESCGKAFSDENGMHSIDIASTVKAKRSHTWNNGVVANEPTCAETGIMTYTCKVCNETKEGVIPKTTHTIVKDAGYPATCAKEGLTAGSHCSVCGEVLEKQEIIGKLAHNYSSKFQKPTCTEPGKFVYTCKDCGYSYTSVTADAPAYGHTIVIDEGTAATCTKDGITEGSHCSVCGEILKEQQVIPAKGHTEDAEIIDRVTEATCTEDGSYRVTVNCADCGRRLRREYVTTAATGHLEVVTKGMPATCTEEGLTDGTKCSVCGEILKQQEVIPKSDHNWSDYIVEKPATCEEHGYQVSTCSSCKITKTEIIPATGHNFVFSSKEDATCDTGGRTVYSCTNCEQEKITTTPAKGHKEQRVEGFAATCVDFGLTDGVICSVCNQVLEEQTVIEPTGHDWGEWTVVYPANASSAGYEQRICKNDSDHMEGRAIPPVGHTHTLVKTAGVPATCTASGTIDFWTCSDCENIFSDAEGANQIIIEETVIPALGHDYKKTVTAPTCTEKGYTTYTCIRGDHSYTADYTDAKGHTAGKAVRENVFPATCTETGSAEDVVYCTDCGIELSRTPVVLPAAGHAWGAWKTTKAATETEDGIETRTCQNDPSHTETRTIPKGSHVHRLTSVGATNPTCTADGNITYWVCRDCGRVFADADGKSEIDIADTVVSAIGHLWDKETTTKEASCTEDGIKTISCSVCGAEKTEVIPATGHSYKATSVVDPTCTEQGYTVYTCGICGDSYKDDYTDAIGHDWGEWRVTKAATESEDGLETRTCKNDASHIETRVINKLSHTHKLTHVAQKAATTETEGNIEYWYCEDCGKYYKDSSTNVEITKAETVIAKLTDKPEDPGKDDPTPAVKTDISKVIISGIEDSYVFTGTEIIPAVELKNGSDQLVEGTDYTVTYKNNMNAGTATVTISGTGNYTGVVTKTFTITAKKVVPVVKLSKASFVYNKKVQKPTVTVTVDGKKLSASDYTVTYAKGSKAAGVYTVTVTLKGNYSGKVTATYQIKPKGTAISKLTGAKKSITVKWKKQATQVTGYQIQYSTNSKFKSGNKTLTVHGIKKTSAKLKKLKAKKTYYVRIRTYRKVNGKTVYSGWSKVKKVKTR